MKKFLLGFALVFAGSAANAAGLYISAGYGKSDPEFNISELSKDSSLCWDSSANSGAGGWSSSCPYGSEYEYMPGFPNGKVLANYGEVMDSNGNILPGVGLQAAEWRAGLPENYDFKTKDGNTMAFAVGWDVSQNPFRFEFEYQKTKFKSPGYYLVINTGEIDLYEGMYQDPAIDPSSPFAEQTVNVDGNDITNCGNGICINAGELAGTKNPKKADFLDFDASFYKDGNMDVDAYMGNVYFEIPGFGSIDPYIGYGFGVAKLKYDLWIPEYDNTGKVNGGDYISSSSAYENANQIIAGVEYRFDETPVIVGVEYRQFKATFKEDDGAKDDFKHKYVMFKLRYDFISDEF